MISVYRAVMDSGVNPLRTVPAAQRFQFMLFLNVMWASIFCFGPGAWLWYGELIVLPVPVAAGVIITGLVFRQASMTWACRTCRNSPLKDGTARHDDVWGG